MHAQTHKRTTPFSHLDPPTCKHTHTHTQTRRHTHTHTDITNTHLDIRAICGHEVFIQVGSVVPHSAGVRVHAASVFHLQGHTRTTCCRHTLLDTNHASSSTHNHMQPLLCFSLFTDKHLSVLTAISALHRGFRTELWAPPPTQTSCWLDHHVVLCCLLECTMIPVWIQRSD